MRLFSVYSLNKSSTTDQRELKMKATRDMNRDDNLVIKKIHQNIT